MELTTYDSYEILPVEWIWPGRIPAGMVSVLAGTSGIAKSTLTCELAARVTAGKRMPLDSRDTEPVPGSVIMVNPEDTPEFTAADRLRKAGANLSKVIDLTSVERETMDGKRMEDTFWLPDDVPLLERAITEAGDVRLVILDPISSVSADTNSVQRVRRQLFGPLNALARKTGVAILLVAHTTKGDSWTKNAEQLKQRIGGSKAITDAARVVMAVVRDQSDPDTRRIHNVKNNLVPEQDEVVYTIDDDGRIVFEGEEAPEEFKAPEWEEADPEEKVRAILGKEKRTVSTQELVQRTGLDYMTVRSVLRKMILAAPQESSKESSKETGSKVKAPDLCAGVRTPFRDGRALASDLRERMSQSKGTGKARLKV